MFGQMKLSLTSLFVFVLIIGFFILSVPVSARDVDIHNQYLRDAIANRLNKAGGERITTRDMQKLKVLQVDAGENVDNLTGLETAINLTRLVIHGTTASDLTPLQGLTRLKYLDLMLASVSDITPLANLTELEYLDLGHTKVSSLKPLKKLTKLKTVKFEATDVSDLTDLRKLKALTYVAFTDTDVSDITPLLNTGLGEGSEVHMKQCPKLTPVTFTEHILTLQLRGVWVFFDGAVNDIRKISGDNQTGSPSTVLAAPLVVEVRGERSKREGGLPVKFRVVTKGSGVLVDPDRVTSAEQRRAQTGLKLRTMRGEYKVRVAAAWAEHSIDFTFTVVDGPAPLTVTFTLPEGVQGSAPFKVGIEFSEGVTGFDTSDITLTTTRTKGSGEVTLTSLTGTGRDYTATLEAPINAEGAVTLTIDKNSVTYGENQGPDEAQTSAGISFDRAPPTVAFEEPEGVQRSAPFKVDIKFSEPVTGLKKNDIELEMERRYGKGKVTFTSLSGADATYIATLTAPVNVVGTVTLTIRQNAVTDSVGNQGPTESQTSAAIKIFNLRADVDKDGDVDIDDLVKVARNYRKSVTGDPTPNPDVTRDGTVDRKDILAVLDVLDVLAEEGDGNAAPSHARTYAERLQKWLTLAKQHAQLDVIALLEQLLEPLLIPKETALLINYPNPFNPETWIPYQLATGATVTLRIYDVKGQVVRTLAIGYQAAGIYKHKSRAAYWDGRNAVGERVASGIYFYVLKAGDFSATRKMLIRK